MILSFTGHRPKKLNNEWDHSGPLSKKIIAKVRNVLRQLQPEMCNVGMCIGGDFLAAMACIEEGIPFVAYVPFKGQDDLWGAGNKLQYRELLSKAKEVIYVSDPPYAPWKMTKRNQAMVDNGDKLCGIYDGSAGGGTFNTIEYAKKKDKEIIYINPNEL